MTFFLIVVVVNVLMHGVALAMVRRPLAADIELAVGEISQFPDDQGARVATIHNEATRRGFRWFGVAMATTWLDKPARPAAIWWNGDIGAWLIFESIGRKWNIELSADLEDGSMICVSKIPTAHLAPPPQAIVLSKAWAASLDDLWAALPVDLAQLPTRRGWPGPGQHWVRAVARRELMLRHWTTTGRAATTADGRGARVSFITANIFVFLGGIGPRQVVQAWANRRSRERLIGVGAAAFRPQELAVPAGPAG